MYIPIEVRNLLDFQVSSSEPATRTDGTALEEHDLWLDVGSSPPLLHVRLSGAYTPVGQGSLVAQQIVSSQTPVDYVVTSDGTGFVYASGAPL